MLNSWRKLGKHVYNFINKLTWNNALWVHTIGVILLKLLVNLIWRDILVITDSSGGPKLCKHLEIRMGRAKLYLKISAVAMFEDTKRPFLVPLNHWLYMAECCHQVVNRKNLKMALTQILVITSELCLQKHCMAQDIKQKIIKCIKIFCSPIIRYTDYTSGRIYFVRKYNFQEWAKGTASRKMH